MRNSRIKEWSGNLVQYNNNIKNPQVLMPADFYLNKLLICKVIEVALDVDDRCTLITGTTGQVTE